MITWYDELQKAMRDREVARNGVKRWELKVAAAEGVIAKLLNDAPEAADVKTPGDEPAAPAALFSGIPADYADSAE
jgi:hypothetical protein